MRPADAVAALLRRTARPELAVILLVVSTIGLMILRLPPTVVDVLLTASLALTVTLLMVALYLRSPVEFSSFPAVILIATLFRLALNITTTRLILIEAEGGAIIETFGQFVVGGNVLVGLVVFLIITVVQFVVIAKGAERVAEVAARFSLDALPGKQLSIDADLRNGDIDQAEARRRRKALEQESNLYGAMDGAMKFVKGDAIAGLVIILVNLLGGIAIGTLQHGMSLGGAVERFSLLTVGDGLVSQIPALFTAMSAGIVVTRVSGNEGLTLGTEIGRQMIADPRALFVAGAVIALLAAVPGLPSLILFACGAAMLAGAVVVMLRRQTAEGPAAGATDRAAPERGPVDALPQARVRVLIGAGLSATLSAAELRRALDAATEGLAAANGVPHPRVGFVLNADGEDGAVRFEVDLVPVADGALPPDHAVVLDAAEHAALAGAEATGGVDLPGLEAGLLVPAAQARALAEAGLPVLGPEEAIAQAAEGVLRRYAAQLFGLPEARELLQRKQAEHPELAAEAMRVVPVPKLTETLRLLIAEEVPLGHFRAVYETLLEVGQREQDPDGLAEAIRRALRRQICHRLADRDRVIAGIILEEPTEQALRRQLRATSSGQPALLLPDEAARDLAARIRTEAGLPQLPAVAPPRVIVCAADLRRPLRDLLVRYGVELAVLSYAEIAPEFTVHPVGTVGLAPLVAPRPQAQPLAADA